MNKDRFDAEEARAHIILLRDGLFPLSELFERTKFVADRYLYRHAKLIGFEEARQISYSAHVLAINTYPINSEYNFFGWAGNTIRREIIDYIRQNNRVTEAAARLADSGETVMGSVVDPESDLFNHEMSKAVGLALNSMGSRLRREIIDHYLVDKPEHFSDTYFKRRRKLNFAIDVLKGKAELREYL